LLGRRPKGPSRRRGEFGTIWLVAPGIPFLHGIPQQLLELRDWRPSFFTLRATKG